MASTLRRGMEIPASVPQMIRALEQVFARQQELNDKDTSIKIELGHHHAQIVPRRTRSNRLCLRVTGVICDCVGSNGRFASVVEEGVWWNVVLRSELVRTEGSEKGQKLYRPHLVEQCTDLSWSPQRKHFAVRTYYFGKDGLVSKIVDPKE